MSSTAPLGPEAAPSAARTERSRPSPTARSWRVRRGRHEDLAGIAAGVRELVVELGGDPPGAPAMQAATRALLEDRQAGAILVAEAEGALVGVLAASWQMAIHVPGRYGLIQDLWVDRSWRANTIGHDLLAALFELARGQGIACVEVGLPRKRFAGLRATEAFYRGNGFTPLGSRMRRILS